MLRPDSGNFNRLLTSLGLALIAAALVIPYFYFRNTDTLEIPASEISRLTATAQSTIEGRQEAISALEPWVIGASIGLCVTGVVSLLFGAAGLKRSQESEQEEAELRKDEARLRKQRAQAEIRDMSPQEREEELDEKAAEEAQDADVDEGEAQASPSASGGEGGDQATAQPDQPTRRVSRAPGLSMNVRRRALERINERLIDIFGSRFGFRANVVLAAPTSKLRLDGFFGSEIDQVQSVVLKLDATSSPRSGRSNVMNRANELIATLSRYEQATGDHPAGWWLNVVPEEVSDQFDLAEVELLGTRMQEAIGGFALATAIYEKDMEKLPSIFEDGFQIPSKYQAWRRMGIDQGSFG